MPDQKSQPGQRNIASQGNRNINNTGDNATFNFHNTPPERSAKHQLRAPVGDFVGRENEIAELISALTNGDQSSISGISGLGGVGKTELALVVADRLLPNYPDAQLLIELRGTDTAPRRAEDALADCVRAFVGIEDRLPDDLPTLVKWYRNKLSGKRVLVLLDNAADANQVHPFLVPPGCALLVTSRETISLQGMKRIRLEQLPPDKARELLQEIAPRVTESVARQICSLCGYLPLAVRAAASLLDVTPDLEPAEYAAELSDERKRLELKYANAEGHEISVEASFNLSYVRLSPEAMCVFRSLAVFPASFDATAEETICQDAGHKCLSQLVRRNLVIFDDAERRYRLHDLARVFAKAQLSNEEFEILYTRQLQFHRDWLEAIAQSDWDSAIQSSDYDSDITSAIKWMMSKFDDHPLVTQIVNTSFDLMANFIANNAVHRNNVEALLDHCKKEGGYFEANVLSALGQEYFSDDNPHKAIEFYDKALVIFRETKNPLGEGNSLWRKALALNTLGEREQAISDAEAAQKIYEEIESPYSAMVREQLAKWRDGTMNGE